MDESVLEFLRDIGVGVRPIRDPFFDESYRVCKVFQRTGVTVEDDETLCHKVFVFFEINININSLNNISAVHLLN